MAKNILILLLFVFAVFSPCLKAGFINLDDDGHILNNAALHDLSLPSIKLIFTQTPNGTYIPLTTLSFAMEKHFFGLNPFVFHLDNLLIYAGIVVLVLLLAGRMGIAPQAGFIAALIFAIHPMRVETVAWVTERKDVLYALFYLLALLEYCSYIKTLSIKHYCATFVFGVLSILAKPMAISLPLVLLIFDWYFDRGLNKRVLWEKVPVFIYTVGIGWISYAMHMRNPLGDIQHGLLVWVWSFCFYLWKFIFPFHVYPYYSLPHPISIFDWPYLLSMALFLVLIFLIARYSKHKLFIFAFLYFFCSIFFLLRFDNKDFSVVSDRFMFLPSLGFCFFIGAWADKRIKTRAGIIIFYIILLLWGVRTNFQCRIWHDSKSFWDEIIREYPDKFWAYNNRGASEDDSLAIIDFSKAIELNPKSAKAYNNRGLIYFYRGEDKNALDDFDRAISIDPYYPEPYLNRSHLWEAMKCYPQALQDALKAQQLGDNFDVSSLKRLEMERS